MSGEVTWLMGREGGLGVMPMATGGLLLVMSDGSGTILPELSYLLSSEAAERLGNMLHSLGPEPPQPAPPVRMVRNFRRRVWGRPPS